MIEVRGIRIAARAAVLVVSFLGVARAQTTIQGIVRDSAGHPVPSAFVRVMPAGLGATTDAAGTYVVSGVPSGRASVLVLATRYSPDSISVTVPARDTVRLNFVLHARQTAPDYDFGLALPRRSASNQPREIVVFVASQTLILRDVVRALQDALHDPLHDPLQEPTGGSAPICVFVRDSSGRVPTDSSLLAPLGARGRLGDNCPPTYESMIYSPRSQSRPPGYVDPYHFELWRPIVTGDSATIDASVRQGTAFVEYRCTAHRNGLTWNATCVRGRSGVS